MGLRGTGEPLGLASDRGGAGPYDADRALPLDPEERVERLLSDLGTRRLGLRTREAVRRLAQHGPNEITRRERRSHLREFVRQFTHPLALLLWAAAALALLDGIAALAVAIVAVIVLNAVFAPGRSEDWF